MARRARLLLRVVGAVALALVGASVALLWPRDESSSNAPRVGSDAPPKRSQRAASSATTTSVDESSSAKRTDEPKNGASSDSKSDRDVAKDANSAFLGDGEVKLKVVDERGGEPIGDLPFVVYSERPSLHVFTRGVTDATGEATIGRLPEDVVIFETPRRPPLAATVFATWLKPGQRKSVEMRVGHGGTIRGRVVDDLGHPLADVHVTIDPRPGGRTIAEIAAVQDVDAEVAKRFAQTDEVVATTDASGRYEAAAIRSRPSSIWIEKKQMSPKREDEAILLFRWQLAGQSLRSLVHEGETVELRDVVFDRCRTYAGRVVDSKRNPVSGALVSARYERSMWLSQRCFDRPLPRDPQHPISTAGSNEAPDFRFDLEPGEEGFALAREETLTRADGSFELALSRDGTGTGAFVATHDGRSTHFALPKASPGSRTDGLEFVLAAQTQLLLDLRESDGAPLELTRNGSPYGLMAGAVTTSGAELHSELHAGGGSIHGVSFDVAPESMAQLVVGPPDHFPATCSFATPPLGRPTITLKFKRKPSFELAFHFHFVDDEQKKLLGDRGLSLSVRARPFDARSVDLADPTSWVDASSFDTQWFQPSRKLDVTLHVPAKRRWSVQVHGPFVHDRDEPTRSGRSGPSGEGEVDLGLFEADGTTHEVELPKVSEEWLAAQAALKKQQEENQSLAKVKPGAIGVVVLDAATNRPIQNANVLFLVEQSSQPRALGAIATGTRELLGRPYTYMTALPGDYSFRVRATGYRDSQLLVAKVASDQPVDAGQVLLESLPAHRLKLLASDGTPAGGGWKVTIHDPNAARAKFAYLAPFPRTEAVADDGTVTLRCELPAHPLVEAWPRGADSYRGGVVPPRFELDAWNDDSTPELRLPALRSCVVVVDQSALAEELRSAASQVWIVTNDAPPTGVETSVPHAFGARASILPLEGERRFTFDAAPGHYVLRARGPFFDADELAIEVKDVDETQEFTLVARPR